MLQLNSLWGSENDENNREAALKFIDSLPYVLDSDLSINLALDLNIQHYLDTDVSIIHETHSNHESVFLSEKIFKPIIVKHPFIIMGSPGLLALLKSYGYKTFHPYIDESYDSEPNLIIRKNMILAELDKIINMTDSQRIHFHKQIADITEFNRSHLYNYSNRQTYGKTIQNEITKHCTGKLNAI